MRTQTSFGNCIGLPSFKCGVEVKENSVKPPVPEQSRHIVRNNTQYSVESIDHGTVVAVHYKKFRKLFNLETVD